MTNWLVTHFSKRKQFMRNILCSIHSYYKMKNIKFIIILAAKALPFILNIRYHYFLLILTIIFYSLVIILLYIHTIGSELDIYSGLSFMFPAIIKLRNKNVNWTDKVYTFDNLIFNKEVLKKFINKFWKDNIELLDKDSHILLLTKIRRDNGQIATIGNLKRLNLDDKDYLIDQLLNIIDLKTGGYEDVPINAIIFSFGIRSGLAPIKGIHTDVKYQNYYHFKFPITMDPLKYGKLIHKMDNTYIIQLINENIAIIDIEDKMNKVKLIKSGELKYEWIDRYIDDSTFIREIANKKYTFVNGELKLLTVEKTNKFMKTLKKAKKQNSNIITMDIETRLVDNKHTPYLLSIYDGNNSKSFFITDYANNESMVIFAIKSLMKRKYKNYKIYLHNFAKFDNIFLFKILANLGVLSPIIHKGRLISMDFNYNDYNIVFRDSYQLLPASLRKLCVSFNVINEKGFFPHTFLNNRSDDILNYNGQIPSLRYFLDTIPVNDNLLNNIDSLKDYFSKYINIP